MLAREKVANKFGQKNGSGQTDKKPPRVDF
jgi:hypothetical protein